MTVINGISVTGTPKLGLMWYASTPNRVPYGTLPLSSRWMRPLVPVMPSADSKVEQ
ncbi:hypothetical protein HS7_04550 [Sulfolobales archaeon HS-7]|nr:hypothetical protein HS7_04550 [Sulfolobales archaeon HS-7]